MDAKELFGRALNQATQIINQVIPTDFGLPTPDTEWDVRTLVGHMLYELSWTADLVAGKTIAEIGSKYEGNLIGEDVTIAWNEAAEAANKAVLASDLQATAHLSYGDVSVEDYIREAASDQLIHTWDLGVAIGADVNFDPEVALAVYDNTLPKAQSMHASGLFAPARQIPADASIQTKLLALYGRDADWKVPAVR